MNKILFAKLLSYIFNPIFFFLLMPYLIVYKQTNNNLYALKWEFFSAAFVIFGLLVIIIGKKKGTFSDFDLSNREERSKFYLLLWPLLITYVIASIFFRGIFFPLSIIAVGIVIGLLFYESVNRKIKASIHVGIATAFVITLGVLFGWTIFFESFWIVPLVSWSRIILKRHTIQEILAGGFLGALITGITILFSKIII